MRELRSLNVEWRDFVLCSPVELGRIASLRKAPQVLQNAVTCTVVLATANLRKLARKD